MHAQTQEAGIIPGMYAWLPVVLEGGLNRGDAVCAGPAHS